MAKKFLLVSVIAAFATVGAFAQVQLSAGAGYIQSAGSIGGMSFDKGGGHMDTNMKAAGNGGFLFFDATYAELSVGLMGGTDSTLTKTNVDLINLGSNLPEDLYTGSIDSSFLAMDIGLLGRYPIPVGKITVSPLLGVGYNLGLSAKDLNGDKATFINDKGDREDVNASDYSTFRIQLGASTDFDVTDNVFVRVQGLAHYRLASKAAKDSADSINKTAKDLLGIDLGAKAKGGFGGSFTFAVGCKF